jgi:hypothetical protein
VNAVSIKIIPATVNLSGNSHAVTNLKPKQDDVFYQIFNMLNITVSLPIECLCPIGKGAEIA